MRYKGEYTPSFLLDPEEYTWHPLEKCIQLLDGPDVRYASFAHPERVICGKDVPQRGERILSSQTGYILNQNQSAAKLEDLTEEDAQQISLFTRKYGMLTLSVRIVVFPCRCLHVHSILYSFRIRITGQIIYSAK